MKIIPTVLTKTKQEFLERLHKLVYLGKDIQVDIMDGVFVPDKSVKLTDIPELDRYGKTSFEVHLMVKYPERYLDRAKRLGFKKVIFHIEPFVHDKIKTTKLIHSIRRLGMQVMIARNPDTPVKTLFPFVHLVDGFLFMGIHPGKEGQRFIPKVFRDIMEFKLKHKNAFVQVDGGVDPYIAHLLAKYDVSAINSGSYISAGSYPEKAVEDFEHSCAEALEFRETQFIANKIRKDIILMIHEARSGHPAGALGLADAYAMLYFGGLLNMRPHQITRDRDYVFVSNGHTCPVLYATLAEKAFFPRKELITFRKINSRLQGHPHIHSVHGVENTSGPLGQGISVAVGTALAIKREGKSNTIFCFCGDGELDEGQVWEGLLCAAHNKLDNFILLIDRNDIQIDGFTEAVLDTASLKKKLEAFNFETFETHGHNMHDIHSTLTACKHERNFRPKAVILKTIPGRGVSFMEGKSQWHGKAPNDKEALEAIHELERYSALLNHTARKHLEAKRA